MILVILIAIALISAFLLLGDGKGFRPIIPILSIGITAIGLVLMVLIDALFCNLVPIGEGTLVRMHDNFAYIRFNKKIIDCNIYDLTTRVDGKPGDTVTVGVYKGRVFGFEFCQYAELKNEEQH
jgi:hypothetical protein